MKAEHEFTEISHIKKRAMLLAYSKCGTVTQAAKTAEISRQSHYNWIDEDCEQYDQEYAEAFELAKKMALDKLVKAARRRAIEGVREPIVYKGEVVEYKLRYSDNLLMFLAKAADPDKYADRKKVEQETTEKNDVEIKLIPPDPEDYIDYSKGIPGEEEE